MYFLRAAWPILVDLASTFFFLAVYEFTHDLKLAIVLGIAVAIVQVGWGVLRKASVPPMQWASLGLVIVLGGASLVTQNPRFVMFKPTVVDAVLAVVMAQPRWLTRYLPSPVTQHVEKRAIETWAAAWPTLMVLLGIANVGVALTQSFEFWVWYSSIAPISCVVILFLAQYLTFRRLIVRKIRSERAAPQ